MFLVWFLVGLIVGVAAGVSCTYAYLDSKFQKSAEGVLNDLADQLARFTDE